MKKHFDEGIVKCKVDEAIDHAEKFELPLKSIELNAYEWTMFIDTMKLVPGFTTKEIAGKNPIYYRSVKIYEEGHDRGRIF